MNFKSLLFVVLISTFLNTLYSQNQSNAIFKSFLEYTKLPREVVYVHLNKTIFFKGEEIAFQAYIFEKGTNLLSKETANLYCILTDSTNTVVNKKLLRVKDGIANGSFQIDDDFKMGNYQFTAITNWMRNFSEKNHYEQQIVVIDPENPFPQKKQQKLSVDAQFLPEGGHAIASVENVYGAIIKSQNGLGIQDIEGSIINSENKEVTKFSTDQFGIGRFLLTPINGIQYFATFKIQDSLYKIPVIDIKRYGVNMKLTDRGPQVNIAFNRTGNGEALHHLTIHNGGNLKTIDLNLPKNQKTTKVLNKKNLYPGINIVTLFDNSGRPLLERLFFNFQDVNMQSLSVQPKTLKSGDSILVTIPIPNLDKNEKNSFSISVLPATTQARTSSHSIASYPYLSPYLRGTVQNAQYYFKNSNKKKRLQFDNLLLTQGWSSYNWDNILTKPPEYRFDFEKGISINVAKSIDNDKEIQVLLSPLENGSSQLFLLNKESKNFKKDLLFPFEDEKLRFSVITKNKRLKKTPLAVLFKPRNIPNFNSYYKSKDFYYEHLAWNSYSGDFSGIEKKIEELNEVVLVADKRKERINNLKKTSSNDIYAFAKDDYRRNLTLTPFLNRIGFRATEFDNDSPAGLGGRFRVTSLRGGIPVIYINNTLVNDPTAVFVNFSLRTIDYIEVDRSSKSVGLIRGGSDKSGGSGTQNGGIIKIFTDPKLGISETTEDAFNEVEIPLAFSRPKRYYNPKYINYDDLSYQLYGAIDWHSNLKADSSANLVFTIPDLGQKEIKFFVEGVMNGNQLVSETFLIKQ